MPRPRPPVSKQDPWHGIWALHQQGYRGRKIAVGHLDSGIDAQHPALRNRIAAYRYFDELGHAQPGRAPFDESGHGTHTAGIICGKKMGVAPKCKLHVAGVLERGRVIARVLSGLDWLGEQDLRVVVMPLGVTADIPVFESMLATFRQSGVLVVAPIGNGGAGRHHTPGASPYVLSVGANDASGRVSAFSGSRNLANATCLKPDVVAPGVDVRSLASGGGQARESGTSMAAAFVAGLAALLFEAVPNATPEDVILALTHTARPLSKTQKHRCRTGIVDPQAALAHLEKSPGHEVSMLPTSLTPKTADLRIDPRLGYLMDVTPEHEAIPAILYPLGRELPLEHGQTLLANAGRRTHRASSVRMIKKGRLWLFEGRTTLIKVLTQSTPPAWGLCAQDVDLLELSS